MREKKSISTSVFISITAIVVLIILLGIGQFRKPLDFLIEPILSAGYSTTQWFRAIPHPFRDKTALLDEIRIKEEENQALLRENAALKTLLEEEQINASIETFLQSIQEQGTPAHVIGKTGGTLELLLIDKGTDDGVQVGQAVITENGFLVGTIHEASIESSQVLLLTDSSQSVAAKIQNDASSPGVVRGEFGLSLLMDLIPQNDEIKKGQTIVTSALEPLLPPQLIIGTVNSVEKTEGEIFQQAKVATPVHINRVEIVSVITSRHD